MSDRTYANTSPQPSPTYPHTGIKEREQNLPPMSGGLRWVDSVSQDLAPSPQPSPNGRGSILSPLALWERGGGEGNLVVAPKS